ncbi:MAG: CoA transferase [Rhodospirillaceae bacterium]|jgi:crotonobetainyl-CoA:carnitine CoA-transferase CaiB-like acyl-CoA transferase|nr:CoA transferase [Rhodospirillaceae bacterium]MBT5896263.1 CoA transferase [Rhodospirillaceae bacterium]MBT7755744.1 CoA transferase [Rhodospirillaceae bacterium]
MGTLDGIRIVELTTVILGPWATQMLGDMGADIVKVETPGGDTTRNLGPRRNEGMASLYLATNRNKRSVVLDLTQEAGRDALFKLVGTADVFVHNMRPKVAKKLGLDYETYAAAYPDLIFCATYGFRKDGPLADSPAYDDVIQAASGLADLQTITANEPRFVPTIMADKTTAFNVVAAILSALVCKERGGGGQAIEVPMFETLVDYVMVEHLYGACFEPPIDQMGYERLLNTGRRPYATKDGYLAVLPYTDANWQTLFEVSGRDDLIGDPRFVDITTRIKHSQEVYDLLGEIVATRTTAEWEQVLENANIPVMAVNTKEMLLENEQLLASGFWREAEHPTEGKLRMTDPPIRFSKTPSTIRSLPPLLGEQSKELLAEAGFSETEIQALLDAKVTKQA